MKPLLRITQSSVYENLCTVRSIGRKLSIVRMESSAILSNPLTIFHLFKCAFVGFAGSTETLWYAVNIQCLDTTNAVPVAFNVSSHRTKIARKMRGEMVGTNENQ